MLGWSIVIVVVLLGGAATLALLATQLDGEVRELRSTLSGVTSLAAQRAALGDEVERTRTRHAGRVVGDGAAAGTAPEHSERGPAPAPRGESWSGSQGR